MKEGGSGDGREGGMQVGRMTKGQAMSEALLPATPSRLQASKPHNRRP